VLNQGAYGGVRVLSPAVLSASARTYTPPGQDPRGLGWLKRPREGSSAGDLLSDEVIYHTGFTGTSLYIDRPNDLFIVLLTNRVHPTRDNDSINRIRPRFCNAVAASLNDWREQSC
jgi:CubicO group peptidase (beta-lactamase class C family)